MSRARQLLESAARPTARQLAEHIIIVNNDGGEAMSQSPDAAGLKDLVARLLQGDRSPSAPDPSGDTTSVKDNFQMKQGGRNWHFSVQRDAEGLITGMDVQET